MLKIKDEIELKELEKFGFRERDFGLYGSGDYIPEHWYIKTYYYRNKKFRLETNHNYIYSFSSKDVLKTLTLYKVSKNGYKIKVVPCNRIYKIVRIVTKDLIEAGLVEKVEE